MLFLSDFAPKCAWRLTVSITAFISICCATLCSAQSVISNGTFDDGYAPWFEHGDVKLKSTVNAYEGPSALRVSHRKTDWAGAALNLTSQLIPDTDYYFSAYVKAAGNVPARIQFEMKQTDDRGTVYFSIGDVLAVPGEWRLLEGGFRHQANGPVTGLQLAISSTDDNLTSYYLDSVTGIQNDWAEAASQRIELIRKRDVELTITDASQQFLADADVSVQQIRHEFSFGSALNHAFIDNPLYADFFASHFDFATVEWFAQWPAVEVVRDVEDYTVMDQTVDFATQNAIELRGHAAFWSEAEFTPAWVDALSNEELQIEMEERIASVIPRYQGSLVHWDVCNEMLTYDFFQGRLGPSIRPWIFEQVRLHDPDVKLFVNELGLVRSAHMSQKCVELVGDLQAGGADVGGIGIQSHFYKSNVSPASIQLTIDRLGTTGLPLFFTELDVVNPDDIERAKTLETFYRYAFSLPEVDGITLWGFWAGTHWLGEHAALFDQDWTANAAGEMYLDLIEEWTTSESLISDAAGLVPYRGFHGDYLITVADPAGGLPSQHLIPVRSDIAAILDLKICHDPGTLTVYGTAADDTFDYDMNFSDRYRLNGKTQLLPAGLSVNAIRFKGQSGNDVLNIAGLIEDTKLNMRTDRTTTELATYAYSEIETVNLTAGPGNDEVNIYDSGDDDSFRSDPTMSSMTTPQITLNAIQFERVIARATGGIDSAELLDSPVVDYGFHTQTYMRIQDPFSLRRANNFEVNVLTSLSGSDRVTVDPDPVFRTTAISPDEIHVVYADQTFSFENFRLTFFTQQQDDPNTVVYIDRADTDERVTVRGDFNKFFGTGFTINSYGVADAEFLGSNSGSDKVIYRDTDADDVLAADGPGFSVTSQALSHSFDGFDSVNAVARGGGQNSTTINAVTFVLNLFGSWDQ